MLEVKCGFDDDPNDKGSALLIQFGPTLFVDVGFDPDWVPDAKKPPHPGIAKLAALVDTGATTSCIDAGLALQLNLPVVDRQSIAGIAGKHEANIHMAQIRVPSLNYTIYGRFAAVDLIAGGQPHHALIGRTFLQDFTMVYEGKTGTVRIST